MDKGSTKFVIAIFGIVVAFGVGVYMGGFTNSESNPILIGGSQIQYDDAYIKSVIGEIEQNYLGNLPEADVATQGIVKGLVDSLGSEYSAYLPPEEARQYLDAADSAYEGVGIYLGFDGQFTTVLTPISGFPADKAGMQSGDMILEVDGQDVAGKRPTFTSGLILGERGTSVDLSIFRESDNEIHEFTIVRERIDLENISYTELENDIVLIDIVRFTEGEEGSSSGVQVFNRIWDQTISDVLKTNPKGIIVDLRNNPGGFVHSVRYVLEDFLKDGEIIMQEQERSEELRVFRDSRDGRLESIPVVVLVNKGSASASEIFAGAIQDNNRGDIVGTATYGKGVEQILVDLQDQSLLMLTYKQWLTPHGRVISKELPIAPDFEVELDQVEGAKHDSQVLKAIQLLKGDGR